MDIASLLDYLFTCTFAFNGTYICLQYNASDLVAILFGIVTAVGGGTIRDLYFGYTLFWIRKPLYILLSIIFGILSIWAAPLRK
jgi:uncharacterized membrane protein YeiH